MLKKFHVIPANENYNNNNNSSSKFTYVKRRMILFAYDKN